MSQAVSNVKNFQSMANSIGMPGGANSGELGFGAGAGPDFKVLNPFINAGKGALKDLRGALAEGFNPGDLTQEPGYQFQLAQGNRSIQQAAGMQGSPFGGNVLQELSQFNQGLAATTYNNAFNRWQTQIQNLAGLAGMGANAAQAQVGGQANTYGSQAGIESSRVGRGGSFFGGLSNALGM